MDSFRVWPSWIGVNGKLREIGFLVGVEKGVRNGPEVASSGLFLIGASLSRVDFGAARGSHELRIENTPGKTGRQRREP